MRKRVLRICLLAYPRERREVDGEALLDLAAELAESNGTLREGLALVRGGFHERVQRRATTRTLARWWQGWLAPVLGVLFAVSLLAAGVATGGSWVVAMLVYGVLVGWAVTAAAERRHKRAARRRNDGRA